MPTSIPIPLSARDISIAEAKYRKEQVGKDIAVGCLLAWAICMLLIGVLTQSGTDTAALETFNFAAAF